MIGGTVLRIVAILISAVFVAGVWISTDQPDFSFLRFYSVAVLVVTIALAIWDKWLWRSRLAQKLSSVSRDVSGTWEARLESLWIDPATQERPPIKTVYLVIRQTSTGASVTLISDESKSRSSNARVIQEDGSWLIHYIYTNEPDVSVLKQSPIHHGSGVLAITGNPAKRVSGTYWTDRDSKGKLTTQRRSKRLGEDLRDCAELFGSDEGSP